MNTEGRCNWILSEGGLRSNFVDPDPKTMPTHLLERGQKVKKVEIFELDSEFFGFYLTGIRVFDEEENILI
jgi:hypothetical protein